MAAKTYAPDTEWLNVDPDTLPDATKAKYDAYREVAKFAAEAREDFERALCSDYADSTPSGQRLAFGYRFGKLSIALVPDDRKPKPSARPATLADFLAARRTTGDRC